MIRLFLCFVFFSLACVTSGWSDEREADAEIQKLLAEGSTIHTLSDRIGFFSQKLEDRPFRFNPLGEGHSGQFDKRAMYRLDTFDCTTFVETVLALSLSVSLEEFQKNMVKIRYKDGHIDFTSRNHFPCVDWVPNNIQAGLIHDITAEVAHPEGIEVAKAWINKKQWYEKLPISRVNEEPGTPLSQNKRWELLQELRHEGDSFSPQEGSLPYVPLSAIFKGKTNLVLLRRIPNGAIINIVRPNWNLTRILGTRLNVSHQGFALWKDGKLYFRHCSRERRRVADVLLVRYLKLFVNSSTIKGINVLKPNYLDNAKTSISTKTSLGKREISMVERAGGFDLK